MDDVFDEDVDGNLAHKEWEKMKNSMIKVSDCYNLWYANVHLRQSSWPDFLDI